MLFVSIVISINTFIISHNLSFPPLCEYAYLNTWILRTLYSIRYAAVWRGVVLFLHLKHDREYSIGHFRIPWQLCTLLSSSCTRYLETKCIGFTCGIILTSSTFTTILLPRKSSYLRQSWNQSLPLKCLFVSIVLMCKKLTSKLYTSYFSKLVLLYSKEEVCL